MFYTGYVLGGNKDIKDYYLAIYRIAASNLQMSFFAENVCMVAFWASLFPFLNHCIIVCVPKYRCIKMDGPDPQFPRPPFVFTKSKYFLTKTLTYIK